MQSEEKWIKANFLHPIFHEGKVKKTVNVKSLRKTCPFDLFIPVRWDMKKDKENVVLFFHFFDIVKLKLYSVKVNAESKDDFNYLEGFSKELYNGIVKSYYNDIDQMKDIKEFYNIKNENTLNQYLLNKNKTNKIVYDNMNEMSKYYLKQNSGFQIYQQKIIKTSEDMFLSALMLNVSTQEVLTVLVKNISERDLVLLKDLHKKIREELEILILENLL